jgi:hypothetical protein
VDDLVKGQVVELVPVGMNHPDWLCDVLGHEENGFEGRTYG